MKSLIAATTLVLLFGVILAAPPPAMLLKADPIEILTNELLSNADGSYTFSYTQTDGTKRTEQAIVKNAGTENATLVISGNITWKSPDGTSYTIDFVADENGYHPMGKHLPKIN